MSRIVSVVLLTEASITVFSVLMMRMGSEDRWPRAKLQLDYYESCDPEHAA